MTAKATPLSSLPSRTFGRTPRHFPDRFPPPHMSCSSVVPCRRRATYPVAHTQKESATSHRETIAHSLSILLSMAQRRPKRARRQAAHSARSQAGHRTRPSLPSRYVRRHRVQPAASGDRAAERELIEQDELDHRPHAALHAPSHRHVRCFAFRSTPRHPPAYVPACPTSARPCRGRRTARQRSPAPPAARHRRCRRRTVRARRRLR